MNHVLKVAHYFITESDVESFSILRSGHINDTFLIKTTTGKHFVLQKLNPVVFKHIEGLISNKVLVSEHLKKSGSPYKTVQFIKTKTKKFFYKDEFNEYWMLMNYIQDSRVHKFAANSEMVYEAGKLYGDFIKRCSSLDAHKLIEILPNFHSMPFRYDQFETALKQANEDTKNLAIEEIEFAKRLKEDMHQVSILKAKNTFPVRVTHNDAKLSNILFDKNDQGLAVIDLDTVMPGITAYDFGDSIRSICATTQEDESNLEATQIHMGFYKAFCEGFAENTRQSLTINEIESLPLGAKTITFTQGLRFLTDFLNGSIYYKTEYETHNLVRARNQFKLVESIQENYVTMEQLTKEIFNVSPNEE